MAGYYVTLAVYTLSFVTSVLCLSWDAWLCIDGRNVGLGEDPGKDEWLWKTALFLGWVAVIVQAAGFLSYTGSTRRFKQALFMVSVVVIVAKTGCLGCIEWWRAGSTSSFSHAAYLWIAAVAIDVVEVVNIIIKRPATDSEEDDYDYDDDVDDDYESRRYERSVTVSDVNKQDRNRKLFEQLYARYPREGWLYDNDAVQQPPVGVFGGAGSGDIAVYIDAIEDDPEVDELDADAYDYYRSRQGTHTLYGSI